MAGRNEREDYPPQCGIRDKTKRVTQNSLTFYKKQTETSKNKFYQLPRPVKIELVARPETDQRGFRVREKLASNAIYNHTNGKGGKLTLPDSLMVLPSTSQIRGLHTFIRNRETPRDEFIFYSR